MLSDWKKVMKTPTFLLDFHRLLTFSDCLVTQRWEAGRDRFSVTHESNSNDATRSPTMTFTPPTSLEKRIMSSRTASRVQRAAQIGLLHIILYGCQGFGKIV